MIIHNQRFSLARFYSDATHLRMYDKHGDTYVSFRNDKNNVVGSAAWLETKDIISMLVNHHNYEYLEYMYNLKEYIQENEKQTSNSDA
jgi:hypothetical protein